MVETSQKLKLADIQIDSLKRTITHAQLTDKEIGLLPAETRTYESLGRMFILRESTAVRENLNNKIKSCDDKIKTLEVSHFFQCYERKRNKNLYMLTGQQNLPGTQPERKREQHQGDDPTQEGCCW